MERIKSFGVDFFNSAKVNGHAAILLARFFANSRFVVFQEVFLALAGIVFVNPPNPPDSVSNKDMMGGFGQLYKGKPATKIPPLDLIYAATVCKKSGIETKAIDCLADGLEESALLGQLAKANPKFLAFRTSTPTFLHDLSVAEKARGVLPDAKIVFFGPQASTFPGKFFECKSVDAIVMGEPDLVFARIAKKGFEKAEGVWFRKGGKIVKNAPAKPLEKLDELPFPDWSLVQFKNYYLGELVKNRTPFLTLLTSRGCPYGCIYCPYPVAQGLRWRFRSAESVLGELDYLSKNFGVKALLVRDAVFTLDRKRTEKICDGIIERKLDLVWRCETRVDALDDEIIAKMAKAGCIGINIGIESADEQVLKNVGRRIFSPQKAKEVVASCKRHGIEVFAFFIIGLPGETRQSVEKSVNFAIELNPEYCQFTIASPYPGTKLRRWAEENEFLENEEWNLVSGYSATMRNEKLSCVEIAKLRDYAYAKVHASLGAVAYRLKKRGPKQLPREAYNFLKYLHAVLVTRL